MDTLCLKNDVHCQQQYWGRLCCLNHAQLVLTGLKCAKKISPATLHQKQPSESDPRQDKFMLFTPNSEPFIRMCCRNQGLPDQATFFQSCISLLWYAHVNCWISFLLHKWHPGIQRDALLHTKIVEEHLWFVFFLVLFQIKAVYSVLWHQHGFFVNRAAAYWMFSLFWTILYKPQWWLDIKILADQQFLK